MNISGVMSSVYKFNSSYYFSYNGTEVGPGFSAFSVAFIISILMSFLINSYVIWLIVTGTGNGLAAEIFVVNLSVSEIILSVEMIVVYITAIYKCDIPLILVSFVSGLFIITRPVFESLICVERYLAVVHPVIFLKFKPLRYRLMCSAVAWGTIFVFSGIDSIYILFALEHAHKMSLAMPFIIISVQLFCCVAVLRALKQSGPGERGREREEENHMKKRAFYIILITTVSMIIIYTPYSILIAVDTQNESNFTLVGQVCLFLAGSVQPVLFFYRVGKLNFIKCQ